MRGIHARLELFPLRLSPRDFCGVVDFIFLVPCIEHINCRLVLDTLGFLCRLWPSRCVFLRFPLGDRQKTGGDVLPLALGLAAQCGFHSRRQFQCQCHRGCSLYICGSGGFMPYW